MRHIVLSIQYIQVRQNVQGPEEKFLVEEYAERGGGVCRPVLYMSAGKGRTSETSRYLTVFTHFGVEVGAGIDGLYCGSTENKEG